MSAAETVMPGWKRIARRFLRPVLAPIDGRVADINRRTEHTRATTSAELQRLTDSIEHTRAALEALTAETRAATEALETRLGARINDVSTRVEQLRGLLDIYTDMAVESAGHSNVELRRLQDSVRALEASLREDAAPPPAR